MILLYSGTPGSGKSYHATRDIIDHMKYKKMPVIANFELGGLDAEWDFNYRPNSELNTDFLVAFANDCWSRRRFAEEGILLVIDECQLLFNSRTWNDADRLKWLEFFSQHRKYGYKIIFVAQDDCMVDKQFRALMEYEVNHRKVSNYGLFGWLLDALTFGKHVLAVRYYFGKRERLDSQYIRLSKKYYQYYNSYKSFEGAGTGALAPGRESRMVEAL